MNDLSFLPSDHAQAEDRAYRYGQKNNVLVYYPIFENTIEGIIYDILNNKKQVIATVMGDNQHPADAAEEILQRINEMRYWWKTDYLYTTDNPKLWKKQKKKFNYLRIK